MEEKTSGGSLKLLPLDFHLGTKHELPPWMQL
ncbi:hypothetical protein CCACVL1_17618 [Corchorus capsularis]|uniref:Uncharacterized protein n=1 Tax=Corchorus capsularis TaxID=210143 RepID=A0A1R3HQU6_COCAP|nr:hypothetical protein CCACVL1_17618 [Corchorus capsularis]